ncbi:MAG: cytochrome c biogenesis protein ResB [Elusimicrobia bacterium]|nr:cytochrome c biogenesis protein ResB [Elusimicrobiota bacterium]
MNERSTGWGAATRGWGAATRGWMGPLASLELTIGSLAALMLLVALCTLGQVKLGLYGSVDTYIRSLLVWAEVPGTSLRVPVFPGGALVGVILLLNLTAAQFMRLEWSRRKAGLWLVHLGLALLFAGEFSTGFFQRDDRMVLSEGATRSWVESPRDLELAVIDATDKGFDTVYSVPERVYSKKRSIEQEAWPFSLLVKRYLPSARIEMRQSVEGGPASMATAGLGPSLVALELRRSRKDDAPEEPALFVEAVSGDRSYGTWLLSTALGGPDPGLGAEQGLTLDGRQWRFALRHRRRYLPFSLTLKRFTHESHPGTDIPRVFSSLVRLSDPARHEDRDVLISMNRPLRYGGQAFYQAGFENNDTVSILQVVKNPGWLLPYLSCVLVGLGLLIHFAGHFWPAKTTQAPSKGAGARS